MEKKKKTEFDIYKFKETDTFLKLSEKTEFVREDKTKLIRIKDFVIKHNGEVRVFASHLDFNENGTVNFKDSKRIDSFVLPINELEKLKVFARKKLIPTDITYFKRNNDICFTKCEIKWYTGFRNNPIKKIINDYELTYPYILSVLKPYTKIDRLHLSSLSIVRSNII